ncbi:beta-lactamase, partial [Ostertagia ostertagi]
FGFADVREEEAVTPNHQFRVGSVSKPITACAILLLVDQGKIELDDKLFGHGSIFGNKFAKRNYYKKHVTDVTVRHLLEHTAGGWDNLQSDAAWIQPQLSTEELITYVLDNVPLEHKPGTKWIYSNFGYQLLGYLAEHLSGMTYESFVKKYIFAPAGVHDIQVAGPSISERAPREVLYYMSGNNLGFDPYEMLPSERIGPWGGWIASPIQLLLFMSRVDGFPHRRDLLSTKSIIRCSTPSSPSNSTYERDFFHELGYVLHHIGNNHDWWNDDKDLFYHLHEET